MSSAALSRQSTTAGLDLKMKEVKNNVYKPHNRMGYFAGPGRASSAIKMFLGLIMG